MSSQVESIANASAARKRTGRLGRYALAVIAALGTLGGWRHLVKHKTSTGEISNVATAPVGETAPRVEVVHPKPGGVERKCVQPGSIHSFETVELYAMIAGYLKTQSVDIGSHVKKGQVLAEIDAPRERCAVAEAAAVVEQARARVGQMESRVMSMEAARDTAAATTAQTPADVERLAASRRLAEKQYVRIKDLNDRRAVDARLADEHYQALETAIAAENTARLAIETARARFTAANVDIEQARADVIEAKAAAAVAEARLATTRVDLDYTRIVAAFDGVVTRRNFHPGSFISSTAGIKAAPVLTVSRTDLMRVVVQVPDRYVVLAGEGDTAVIKVDGLAGRSFQGAVSRVSESENPTTRMMRVEIDLPNPNGLLREGMYGAVTIDLDQPSKRLTVPVACLVERTGDGDGVVQVVHDGKARKVKVSLGGDDGSVVEIASGLETHDQVVLRTDGPLVNGADVIARSAG